MQVQVEDPTGSQDGDTTDVDTQEFDDARFDPGHEFDRQQERLVELNYGALTGLGDDSLRALLQPLRSRAVAHSPSFAGRPAAVPFVTVLSLRLAGPQVTMPLVERRGRPGFVSPDLQDVDRFVPSDSVQVPEVDAYLLLDVDRGDEYLSWRPDEALPAITAQGRTPLTVAEGVALVTLFPESLEKNRCFMLLGSRCGDKRVPAIWISGGSVRDGGSARRGAAKLGWCWAGNLHTWLGHASAAARLTAEVR